MAGQFARAKRTADKLTANVDAVHRRDADDRGVRAAAVLRPASVREMGRAPRSAGARGVAAVDDRHLALRARRRRSPAKATWPERARNSSRFLRAPAKIPPETPVGMLNTAGQLFAVARPLLDGTHRGGRRRSARRRSSSYKAAVAAEDALAYDEPPTWYYPVRETLGAALLANGEGRGRGAGVPEGSEIQPAQRPLAVRPVEVARGAGDERRRRRARPPTSGASGPSADVVLTLAGL